MVLITHDLALASEYCDHLVIMHAGQVVETGPTSPILASPHHPYTQRLLRSVPSMVSSLAELEAIDGALPDLRRDDLPACRFAERCARRLLACDMALLPLQENGPDRRVACRNPL